MVKFDNKLLDYKKVHERCLIRFIGTAIYGKNLDDVRYETFQIYKQYDCSPLFMQGLFKKFFHWMNEDENIMKGKFNVGQIVANFIFFMKRQEEMQTKHLEPDWLLNQTMTENIALIPEGISMPVGITYTIQLSKLLMTVEDKDLKQEATIQVGQSNQDNTTYGDKGVKID